MSHVWGVVISGCGPGIPSDATGRPGRPARSGGCGQSLAISGIVHGHREANGGHARDSWFMLVYVGFVFFVGWFNWLEFDLAGS